MTLEVGGVGGELSPHSGRRKTPDITAAAVTLQNHVKWPPL
jgi:hypothetical protein